MSAETPLTPPKISFKAGDRVCWDDDDTQDEGTVLEVTDEFFKVLWDDENGEAVHMWDDPYVSAKDSGPREVKDLEKWRALAASRREQVTGPDGERYSRDYDDIIVLDDEITRLETAIEKIKNIVFHEMGRDEEALHLIEILNDLEDGS